MFDSTSSIAWTIGFVLLMIIFLFVAVTYLGQTSIKDVESRCKEICLDNGDKYYDSRVGGYSNDVCLCKSKDKGVYSLNIG